MEKTDFLEKPLELAQQSQFLVEKLWETQTEISKFYAPLTSIFSSIFSSINNALLQELSLNKAIYDLALTRFALLFPYDLWAGSEPQLEEEYLAAETGSPNISFMLHFSVARKLVSSLAAKPFRQTSERALFPAGAPSPGAEAAEAVFKKSLEEAPETNLFHSIAQLQNEVKSKLAPSAKSTSSVLSASGGEALPLSLFAATSMPELLSHTAFRHLASYRFPATPAEKAPAERDLTEESFVLGVAEAAQPGLPAGIRLSSDALRSLGYAAELPAVISEPLPFLEIAVSLPWTSSWFQPAVTSAPNIKPPYHYPAPISGTPTPMPPSQLSLLLKEISPSLTSWVYGASQVLRRTVGGPSAAAVAASTAEKLVTETLTQPISSWEAPRTYGKRGLVSQRLTSTKLETEVRRGAVETFWSSSVLPAFVASYAQTYRFPPAELAVGEVYEAPFGAGRVYSEHLAAPSEFPSETAATQKLSRLSVMLALVATEGLIAQRLRHEMAGFAKEIEVAQSTYGEALAEIGAVGPVRTTMLGELASGLAAPSALEPYAPSAPPVSLPPRRPPPVAPTAQTAVNLTISAETAEEDLRDLERKINRILSEQISRYYGSSKL